MLSVFLNAIWLIEAKDDNHPTIAFHVYCSVDDLQQLGRFPSSPIAMQCNGVRQSYITTVNICNFKQQQQQQQQQPHPRRVAPTPALYQRKMETYFLHFSHCHQLSLPNLCPCSYYCSCSLLLSLPREENCYAVGVIWACCWRDTNWVRQVSYATPWTWVVFGKRGNLHGTA